MASCSLPEDYVLVIAEKPKAAARIAFALGGRRASKCSENGVPYWILPLNGETLVVGSAAGHLFGIRPLARGFPVFSYEWAPLYEVEKGAKHTKKFYEALRKLALRARIYVNACDYDIEGSLIGYMVIEAFGDPSRARRMRFSSLTEEELKESYRKLGPLDTEMVEAGRCRHELDWIWGINVSRALMASLKAATGEWRILSAGRVQSPTLAAAVERDMERRLFVPLPQFNVKLQVEISGETYTLEHLGGAFETRREAEEARRRLREAGVVTVDKSLRRRVEEAPPPAFNLGDLQMEASRIYGFSPYKTQRIAEQLYLNALISYPRTNSQKLPATLNYRRILGQLARIDGYSSLVESLLEETGGRLKPRQGRKDDPAHPAIYPTGRKPGKLSREEQAVHDLIVRRFLAAFSKPHVYYRETLIFTAAGMRFRLSGLRVLEEGWRKYYHFKKRREASVPELREGEQARIRRVSVTTTYTKPPQAFTKASLVKWMEEVGIGTEATRARIAEVLFTRKYLSTGSRGVVEATDLGMSVYGFLKEFFPDLIGVELTRRFEEYMEEIRIGRKTREKVLEEAKRILTDLIERFKPRMKEAGSRLGKSLGTIRPTRRCPICGRESVPDNLYGFCRHHSAALRELRRAEAEWLRRMGVRRTEFLSRISDMGSAGRWVRDVASYLSSRGR